MLNADDALDVSPSTSLQARLLEHGRFLKDGSGARLKLIQNTFSRLVIDGFRFDHAEISDCRFGQCNLPNSRFQFADLSDSVFIYCNLTGCDFSSAKLTHISILHSDVRAAIFNNAYVVPPVVQYDENGLIRNDQRPPKPNRVATDFSGSNFRGADLSGAVLTGSSFVDANFQDANLIDADFTGADLSEAVFTGTALHRAKLKGAKLDGAIFPTEPEAVEALGHLPAFRRFLEARGALDEKLAMHAAWVESEGRAGRQADFSGVLISGVDFSNRLIGAIDFTDCVLKACRFNGANLAAARLERARLSYCDFSEADMRGCYASKTEFRFCNFDKADFSELAIRGGRLRIAADVNGAQFTNCDLRGTILSADQIRQAEIVRSVR
jgi:uncharacterized protein YjbI with pentapeptide repeats